MNLKLVLAPNKRLLKPCTRVPRVYTQHRVLAELMHTKMKEWGGVGLAAPQVGFNIQLIVIDTRKNNRESRDGRRVTLFNPVITEMYGEQQVQEGCLSFPGQSFAKIRPMNVKVKYTTPDGAYMESWFEGLAAQVIIHEIFHLHGILLDNPTIDDVYCLLNKGEKDAE